MNSPQTQCLLVSITLHSLWWEFITWCFEGLQKQYMIQQNGIFSDLDNGRVWKYTCICKLEHLVNSNIHRAEMYCTKCSYCQLRPMQLPYCLCIQRGIEREGQPIIKGALCNKQHVADQLKHCTYYIGYQHKLFDCSLFLFCFNFHNDILWTKWRERSYQHSHWHLAQVHRHRHPNLSCLYHLGLQGQLYLVVAG